MKIMQKKQIDKYSGKSNNQKEGKKEQIPEDTIKEDARKWWSELSINEQNKHIKNHPFFSKMGRDYFSQHKNSVTEVYKHFKNIK
jgi:hypothetical protein